MRRDRDAARHAARETGGDAATDTGGRDERRLGRARRAAVLAARLALVAALAPLAAAARAETPVAAPAASPGQGPGRVVAMNLCADQLAMLLAAPGQLVSVSSLAADPRSSVMWREASAYELNHGRAEEVFLMRPDLVLAGTWSARAAVDMLRRLDVEVAEIPIASSFADVRANLRQVGALLGREAEAERAVAAMDARLAEAQALADARPGPEPLAVLRYENGFSSGAGTLADDILSRAGLRNLAAEAGATGMTRLSLERLVMADPDLLIRAPRNDPPSLADEAPEHPALVPLIARSGGATTTSLVWVCGLPFAAEAVADMARAAAGAADGAAQKGRDANGRRTARPSP